MISLNSVVFGSGPVGFGVSVNFWTLTRPNKHFPIPNMYYCYKHHSSKNPIIRIFLSEEPLQYTHTHKKKIYIYTHKKKIYIYISNIVGNYCNKILAPFSFLFRYYHAFSLYFQFWQYSKISWYHQWKNRTRQVLWFYHDIFQNIADICYTGVPVDAALGFLFCRVMVS